jgi:hypothetical protein
LGALCELLFGKSHCRRYHHPSRTALQHEKQTRISTEAGTAIDGTLHSNMSKLVGTSNILCDQPVTQKQPSIGSTLELEVLQSFDIIVRQARRATKDRNSSNFQLLDAADIILNKTLLLHGHAYAHSWSQS